MLEATPKTVYLKDYQPPEFLVDAIDLFFELDAEATRVTSRLKLRHNPAVAEWNPTLVLDGEQLAFESAKLNGRVLAESEYGVSESGLVIHAVPERPFELEITNRINPEANTALEGLYLSDGMFCTQCEPHGFRRITYYIDRPDVMSLFTTTIVADQSRYPVLLSNGNRIASGELKNGRHWVRWEDPFKKPCYLFALVAGRLACLEDRFVTASGREIALQIYVEPHDRDKCDHAMQSLKHAMRWDEERFGREYDLDLYMIVAVSHFNMGAMENKGLNIFNTKFVLARPDTATDADYEHIEGVIGHEYFHNWTGNRITCRDWFQLSLKEGLTVFRDQEFSASRSSRAVKRIEDVNLLRTRQFAEDAGPLAHPVRPDSYIEINNFYTLTVYEKGGEVVRMMQTMVGPEGFRKGMDLYFERHDGQAVTCDDFVRCMEDANGIDLSQFRLWYAQAGTPELRLDPEYDAGARTLRLFVRQSCPPTPGQPVKQPLHVPLALGLLAPDGSELPLRLAGEAEAKPGTRVLHVREAEQVFEFVDVPERPVVSALRGFSAPVRLKMERSAEELAFLFAHDTDAFSRWDAGQTLATQVMLGLIERIRAGENPETVDSNLVDAFRRLLAQPAADPSYQALLLSLPSEDYVAALMSVADPEAIHRARQIIRRVLATVLAGDFLRLYREHQAGETGGLDPAARNRRRIKNTCLGFIAELETSESYELCVRQFREARTMTDQIAALAAIVNSANPEKTVCLESFYAQWREEALVIDKWFSLQASCPLPGTLESVKALTAHPDFDLRTPNRVRSLIGAFSQANPVNFHAADGSGYEFLGNQIVALNAINPQVAARMLGSLTQWRRYDKGRQDAMCRQLQRIAGLEGVSKDVYEVAVKSLA
ncbi:aminopeptidase N [Methylococcus geothermalis]|uniref:Aminopeptidase N n=1 Tax=Methylococcus geothermalis TaxID=2681310 RepID=A0A858Q5Y1_9GAMM|nr:aminopeptidase N [Methylococcus geothermalis]QJD29272.1 aminopeptidase N [Methylococcus geothermalis]